MAREDWTREERDEWRRREADRERRRLDDYGQADYSTDYGYDPERRTGYRADADDRYPNEHIRDVHDREYRRRMDAGDYRRGERDPREGRSWADKAGDFFTGGGEARAHDRREMRERDEDAARRDVRRVDDDYDRARAEDDGRDPRREGRSFMDRAGDFLAGGAAARGEDRRPRRRGPSDRVLWAVIVERLEDERRLDLRDVDVVVQDAEVTLNGTVRRKEDRRRIEDIADIDGVRHVQNNLRVRDRDRGWTFI